MKQLYLVTLLFGMLACFSSCKRQTTDSTNIVVCGDDQVLIINVDQSAQGKHRTVWQWKVEEAKSQIPEKYQKLLIPLDECKSVDNGSKLLLTSSGGGVLLLEKDTKKCLFYAEVPMAHSAELLPGNKIAVALSTHPQSNSVELYDIAHPEQRICRDSLYSGHGVVWMSQEERLYALGYDTLRSYKINSLPNDSVSLLPDKTWTLPSIGGHDLNAVGRC